MKGFLLALSLGIVCTELKSYGVPGTLPEDASRRWLCPSIEAIVSQGRGVWQSGHGTHRILPEAYVPRRGRVHLHDGQRPARTEYAISFLKHLPQMPGERDVETI